MTVVHLIEHREIVHIPGQGQQYDMDITTMHIASSRAKAIKWIKAESKTGHWERGYFAIMAEAVDEKKLASIDSDLEFYDLTGNKLEDQPCSPDRWYLLSIMHSRPANNAFTWWGKDSAGYTISLEEAGVYTKAEADKIVDQGKLIHNGVEVYRTVAIQCGWANRLGCTIVPIELQNMVELNIVEQWKNKRHVE